PPVLRGEAAGELSPSDRAHLESLALAARDDGLLDLVRDECAARLRQPKASRGVEYLLAHACALKGERERAHQTLLALGERLAAAGRYAGLEEVALEFAEHADLAGLLDLIRVLPQVGARGALKEAKQLLDLAFPPIAAAGRAGEALDPLRSLLAHAAEKGGAAA